MGDIEVVAGARAFLASLPRERWTVVTSAPRLLAEARMRAADLALPPTMITAEDAPRGKPAPDCFLLGAERLGVAASDCLIFEDAPPGIAAAEAAGGAVIVVSALHHKPLETRHPKIDSFDQLQAEPTAEGMVTVRWTGRAAASRV